MWGQRIGGSGLPWNRGGLVVEGGKERDGELREGTGEWRKPETDKERMKERKMNKFV